LFPNWCCWLLWLNFFAGQQFVGPWIVWIRRTMIFTRLRAWRLDQGPCRSLSLTIRSITAHRLVDGILLIFLEPAAFFVRPMTFTYRRIFILRRAVIWIRFVKVLLRIVTVIVSFLGALGVRILWGTRRRVMRHERITRGMHVWRVIAIVAWIKSARLRGLESVLPIWCEVTCLCVKLGRYLEREIVVKTLIRLRLVQIPSLTRVLGVTIMVLTSYRISMGCE
jgi:hypothetical protein